MPSSPEAPRENIFNLSDDVTWIRGRHSWKFGFDGRLYRPAALVQQTPNGIITFANQFSNQINVPGTGSAVADLLLGDPTSVRATQFAETNGWVSLKYYYYGGYAQDEIRLKSNFVRTVGLRYGYRHPITKFTTTWRTSMWPPDNFSSWVSRSRI